MNNSTPTKQAVSSEQTPARVATQEPPPSSTRRGAASWNWLRRPLEGLISIAALLLVWQLAVVLFDIPAYVLPRPWDVLVALVDQWDDQLAAETMVTFQESVGGFLLAIVVSVPLAILITYSDLLSRLVMPALVIAQVIPKIALAPLFVIWLGFGILPKILMSFLVAFFAIVVSTVVGLKNIEPNMLHLSRSMGASTLQTFLKVRLPNSLPTFFGGLKVGVTLAVIGAIVGEFVGAGSGLGHLTIIAMASLNLPLTFAAILMMGVIGVLMYAAVEILERLAVPWKKSGELDQIQGTM
ncbi:MAG: ABC transporter permease [Beutenbergiaceae bacterium]